jgi:hypothetical protein
VDWNQSPTDAGREWRRASKKNLEEIKRLRPEIDSWIAQADALVESVAPEMLSEYKTGGDQSPLSRLVGAIGTYPMQQWGPFRERLDGLRHVAEVV